jgi:hypothetical protein
MCTVIALSSVNEINRELELLLTVGLILNAMDASTFFNIPRLSDVVIVLVENEDASRDGPSPKRRR